MCICKQKASPIQLLYRVSPESVGYLCEGQLFSLQSKKIMIDVDMAAVEQSLRSAEHEGEPVMFPTNGSAFERGLDCINSILQPGSRSFDALSKDQRQGLKDLKAMLISGASDNTQSHIPEALLTSEDSNSNYLLAEYAGITSPRGRAFTSMNKVLSAQKVAMKFKKIALKRLSSQATGTTENGGYRTNLPEFWNDLDGPSKLKLKDLLSWESISRWDFNIFDVDKVLKGKNTLVFISWAIIASPHAQFAMEMSCSELSDDSMKEVLGLDERRGYNFIGELKIREKTLIEFLKAIEDRYNPEVSYHNHVHAADVTQSVHALLQMGGTRFTEEKLELFSMLISAVVHDVGHNGLNNNFHINSRSELAILYNDVSVLENMHVSSMFKLILGDHRERKLDIFENFDEDQITRARDFIIKAVLATDMKKHFAKINFIKGLIIGADDIDEVLSNDIPKDVSLRSEVLSFIIHLADISNPSKGETIATIWTDKLLTEFFKQGDLEESMGLPFSQLCDRSTTDREKSQVGFINFIVLPSYELLGKLIPQVEAEIVPQLHDNLKYWKDLDKRKQEKLQNGTKSLPLPKSSNHSVSNGTKSPKLPPKAPKKPNSTNSVKSSKSSKSKKKDKKDKKERKEKKEKKAKKQKESVAVPPSPKERSGTFSLKLKNIRDRVRGRSSQFTLRNR